MSKRTEQVAELLRQEINNIIIKDFESHGYLISVAQTTVSPDLKNATAYLSIIPTNKIGTGLSAIKHFQKHIQKELNSHLAMRSVPKIQWEIDNRDLKYKEIDDALNKSKQGDDK